MRLSTRLMALGMALALPTLATAQTETARGVVYEDLNGNRVRDAGEPGIEGVAVSNQRDVVLTDDEGRYELPVEGNAVIFIRKPSGYAVPLSDRNLPQFFYVHRPTGSPPMRYAGVEPTGTLPEAIDFALMEIDEPATFRALAMADPQPENGQELDYLRRDVFSELVGQDLEFGVVLGDIMFDNLDLYPAHIRAIGRIGIPFYHVVGNHDINFDAPPDESSGEQSNETFIRYFGPDNFSWDVGEVHFISLDNIIKDDGNEYREGFTERQLAWLRNDLAHVDEEKLIVICTHSPIRFHEASRENPWIENHEGLFDALAGRERILAISGHTHYNFHRHFTGEDGWEHGHFHQINAVTACGSWWSGPTDVRGIPVATQRDGTPNGYMILEFDGDQYMASLRAAGFGADHQMHIFPPGEHRGGENPRRTLLVNVFDGRPDTVVEYRLDGGEWRPMEQRPQEDPVAQQLYTGPGETGKTWVNPVVSDHIWEAEFGEGEPGRGTHVVTVRATLADGRVFEHSRIW